VFGASEVVHYFTVNGLAEFHLTVQSALPSIQQLILTRISAQDDRRNCVVWPRRLLAGVGGCELPEQSGRVVTATAGIA
jgi:hypothetical protein